MNEYKNEIKETRKGSLGSSDGKLLLSIATNESVPKSALKRLAVCKGLIEQTEIPYTDAVRTGDEIELAIYEHLKATNPLCESNPLVVSTKYSRKNVRLLSHPDIRIKDDDNKVLTYIEIKASKYTTEQVRHIYKAQLFIHTMLAIEEAQSFGKGWKVRILLAHYSTEGIDLSQGCGFDPERLTVKQVRIERTYFDLCKTMDIINAFLEDFNEYYEGDEVDADMLPQQVRTQFDEVATFLAEIKEREAKVDEFKCRLFQFMQEKEIKSIKCDAFSITRVDEATTRTFDAKRYLEDFKQEHPRRAERIILKYSKETKKKGYCLIKLNKNKDVEDIFK